MKWIISGSRHFDGPAHTQRIVGHLDRIAEPHSPSLVIHGAARGTDDVAGAWASNRGIDVEAFPAAWERHGRRAGPIRNQEMIHAHPDALLIAFPGAESPGTRDMIRQATEARMHHIVVDTNGDVTVTFPQADLFTTDPLRPSLDATLTAATEIP